jgi:hypothetical protein
MNKLVSSAQGRKTGLESLTRLILSQLPSNGNRREPAISPVRFGTSRYRTASGSDPSIYTVKVFWRVRLGSGCYRSRFCNAAEINEKEDGDYH